MSYKKYTQEYVQNLSNGMVGFLIDEWYMELCDLNYSDTADDEQIAIVYNNLQLLKSEYEKRCNEMCK